MRPRKPTSFFAAPLAALILFLAPAAAAKESIVDYYKAIPDRLLGDSKYSLQLKGGAWSVRSVAGYALEPVVDLDRGYLQIKDPGTGGGSVTHELALYRAADGSALIGVNLTRFDGVGSSGDLAFYDPAGGEWREVTGEVLPHVDLSLFLSEDCDPNKIKPAGYAGGIAFLYRLPRFGTAATVRIELDRLVYVGGITPGPIDPGIGEIIKNIKYGEVELAWDKAARKFAVGAKTPFEPSEPVQLYLDLYAEEAGLPRRAAAKPDDLQPGDPERKAILDALRREWFSQTGLDIVFKVLYLKARSGWAWVHVRPQTRDGQNRFEDVSGLMQKIEGRWTLAEIRSAEIDDPESSDDALYFKRLKLKYPALPQEILPSR